MELTGIVNTRRGDYVVVIARKAILVPAVMQVFKYHCSGSKNYQVTFELDNGAQRMSVSADFLYYSKDPVYFVEHTIHNHKITGVVAVDLEEARAIEVIIEKAYAWALLKE